MSKKQLILEGFEGAFVPDAVYVKQGEKVWFASGKPTQITESISAEKIVELFEKLELIERDNGVKEVKDGIWVVEGVFQLGGIKNQNTRTYQPKTWKRLIAEGTPVMKAVEERSMIGHLEHPENGRTDGKEGGLLVTKLWLTENTDGTNVVHGRAELLNTPNGRILQEYSRKGVKWGVSSRASGAISDNGLVEDDGFTVHTWDAVMSPSTPGAFPKTVKEGGSVNEEIKPESVLTEAQELLSTEITPLDESDRSKLIKDMMRVLGQVTTLTAENKIPANRMKEIFDALVKKVQGVVNVKPLTEGLDEGATHIIQHNVYDGKTNTTTTHYLNKENKWSPHYKEAKVFPSSDAADEHAKKHAGTDNYGVFPRSREKFKFKEDVKDRVMESLRNKVQQLETTNEGMATRLSDVEAELTEAEEQRAELQEQVESLTGELTEVKADLESTTYELTEITAAAEEAQTKLEETEQALTAALAQVTELTEMEVVSPVQQAVAECIRQNPKLRDIEESLLQVGSVDALNTLVAGMNPTRSPRSETSVGIASRRSLPTGVLTENVNSDERKPTTQNEVKSTSTSLAMTRKVLNVQKQQQAVGSH